MKVKTQNHRIESVLGMKQEPFRPNSTIELCQREEPRTTRDADTRLTCRECGKQFIFTEGEREFYDQRGLTPPARCKECRSKKDKALSHSTCSECGTKLEKVASVYCDSCASNPQSTHLTCSQCGIDLDQVARVHCESCVRNLQLDSERKIKKIQRAASATQTKIQAVESRNEDLQKSLYEMKQYVAELELRVKNLTQDLEKANQFYVASGWLQPALDNLAERLKTMEQAQRESKQKVSVAIQEIRERFENISLWEVIRRSFLASRTNGSRE
jgi:DNA repair exonuclease SbcCD ATPase subunit